MNRERNLPTNPLDFIKACVTRRRILWTYHVNLRLAKRFIPREAILDSASTFEIIESYPEDKYLPSYLIRSEFEGRVFHVLIAADVEQSNVRIVTAYTPDPEEWDDSFRERRPPS